METFAYSISYHVKWCILMYWNAFTHIMPFKTHTNNSKNSPEYQKAKLQAPNLDPQAPKSCILPSFSPNLVFWPAKPCGSLGLFSVLTHSVRNADFCKSFVKVWNNRLSVWFPFHMKSREKWLFYPFGMEDVDSRVLNFTVHCMYIY